MNPLDQKNVAEEDGGISIEKSCVLLSSGSVPMLLKKAAGGENCCIFRIPKRPNDNNQNNYEPRVVSIGPYHHGKKHLQMIQEHKHRFLELFMDEARKKDVETEDLIEAVSLLKGDIMDSYTESLDLADAFNRNGLIDMMVLDACFILMLFFVVAKEVQYSEYSDDPLFRMRWILPAIRKDLLLLENQVPFFLLQTIFEKSKIVTSCGLNEIALGFFSCSIEKLDKFSPENRKIKAKHLLDLIRKSFRPLMPRKENQDSVSRPFLKLIPSANDLRFQGLNFENRNNAKTLLHVGLNREMHSVEIPRIVLDDFIISVFRNCVAFEQFYGDCTNHVTSYVAFMGCLIKNEADAKFLTDKWIIENYFGTTKEIFETFKDISKDISFDLHESYLAKVFEGINESTALGFRVRLALLKHTYFDEPWTFYSYVSAVTLFLLAVMQVWLALIPFTDPPKDKK